MVEETAGMLLDIFITVLAVWVAYVFWQAGRRRRDYRSILIAVAFAVIALGQLADVLFVEAFGIEQLEWLESHNAISLFLAVSLAAVALAVSSGVGWGAPMAGKPEAKRGEKAA